MYCACMHDAVTLQCAMCRGGRARGRVWPGGGLERDVDLSERKGLGLDVTGYSDELQISTEFAFYDFAEV